MTSDKIGLTLGDPGGIGPELILKLFSRPEELPPAEFIIFGQQSLLDFWSEKLKLKPQRSSWPASGRVVSLRETGQPLEMVIVGKPAAEQGLVSFSFFEAAVDSARRGEIQALVTAPISKIAWVKGGLPFRGHTEYLEKLYPEAIMSFWSDRLRVALFTHHLPLREAIDKIKKDNLIGFFQNLDRDLKEKETGIKEMLVCGLNPHAGEDGSIGQEEQLEIIPALDQLRKNGLEVKGPLPPDTIFRQGLDRPDRLVVSLYHDQGLIPFKLVAFDRGVNLTLGLPFVRTSPDHGTAFELAGLGLASPASFQQAIWLAWKFGCQKKIKSGS
ncbi:MAG TPA: 4-hydroxythreonine-4-phosphate dehydrogenase PdxA [Candidatus Saccharicenans sp.]|jgi:4-hydroxythreonine-4-phosphate dehydrogenase|nr:4-hydroxythreonine-4-phosphate dehydrogenase PdxA [Candidatus Saccharicenans sp.]HOJ25853.1 4-hydroxythreonine-4-phosphate dehydrogenase PdxA [Candidatus Saccharicenans sp.]HOL45021.1 4-hydroxythreonine-4-phosphate dehydrogenase PdxA [Candidatus Saccharicenans sp.]HOM93440.1 4-hydroxythreonine-4-phosphate dehydrogenase PdxA [Candidatus Saccharicenans sp.]HOT68165.1 4-hydroxythreonine-4-phosphate dehydrogenase PdxA [Candidatus Saccharicenans sp.]